MGVEDGYEAKQPDHSRAEREMNKPVSHGRRYLAGSNNIARGIHPMSLTRMPLPGFTTEEVARLLNIAPKAVRSLVVGGKLDALEVSPRLWVYSAEAFQRYVASRGDKK